MSFVFIFALSFLLGHLLMGSFRYDFFKTELLKTPYFDDNIICHFAASFATVRPPFFKFFYNTLDSNYEFLHLGDSSHYCLFSCGCTQGWSLNALSVTVCFVHESLFVESSYECFRSWVKCTSFNFIISTYINHT